MPVAAHRHAGDEVPVVGGREMIDACLQVGAERTSGAGEGGSPRLVGDAVGIEQRSCPSGRDRTVAGAKNTTSSVAIWPGGGVCQPVTMGVGVRIRTSIGRAARTVAIVSSTEACSS